MPLYLVVVPLIDYRNIMLAYLYNYSIGFGARGIRDVDQ